MIRGDGHLRGDGSTPMGQMYGHYVPVACDDVIRSYRYKGSDLSYTYKYFLSPFAEFLIQFMPMTIAPNVVTVVGFTMVVMSSMVAIYHSPGLDGLPQYVR